MAVWYLDNDDEITDAVARLRAATDDHVVFVIPPGSRIATGRINFKLLAREASSRGLALAVASPDEQVRALASAAGVLARQSADDAEASLRRGDSPSPSGVERFDEGVAQGDGGARLTSAASHPPEGSPAPVGSATRPSGRRLTIAAAAVVGLVAAGAVASLELLPTAAVTLRPGSSMVGPVDLEVLAVTSLPAIDPVAGQVPARPVEIPLQVKGTFPATGAATLASRAAGAVVFSSTDQTFDQEIVAGTRVRTLDGVEFQTTEAVVLERPDGGGNAQVSAPVEAVEAGPEGNVAAGAIGVVPSLESQGIGVTNPRPTTGGQLEETPIVTRGDVDAASVDLRNRLTGALAARLREPDLAPQGQTLYPETATLGPIRQEPGVDELVGSSASQFELVANATAQVLAVDPEEVEAVLHAALEREVPSGMALIPETVRIEVGKGEAVDDRIAFAATAHGTAHVVVDPGALRARIAGLPVSDARAILEGLGTASVEVWPDFLGGLPGDPERIDLQILEPSTTE